MVSLRLLMGNPFRVSQSLGVSLRSASTLVGLSSRCAEMSVKCAPTSLGPTIIHVRYSVCDYNFWEGPGAQEHITCRIVAGNLPNQIVMFFRTRKKTPFCKVMFAYRNSYEAPRNRTTSAIFALELGWICAAAKRLPGRRSNGRRRRHSRHFYG